MALRVDVSPQRGRESGSRFPEVCVSSGANEFEERTANGLKHGGGERAPLFSRRSPKAEEAPRWGSKAAHGWKARETCPQ